MREMELDALVTDAFRGGERPRRELRLSDADARALAWRYPAAVEPLGEHWYQVTFKGAMQFGA